MFVHAQPKSPARVRNRSGTFNSSKYRYRLRNKPTFLRVAETKHLLNHCRAVVVVVHLNLLRRLSAPAAAETPRIFPARRRRRTYLRALDVVRFTAGPGGRAGPGRARRGQVAWPLGDLLCFRHADVRPSPPPTRLNMAVVCRCVRASEGTGLDVGVVMEGRIVDNARRRTADGRTVGRPDTAQHIIEWRLLILHRVCGVIRELGPSTDCQLLHSCTRSCILKTLQ